MPTASRQGGDQVERVSEARKTQRTRAPPRAGVADTRHVPDIHDSGDRPTRTVPLTIHLSTESMSALQALAELYHATPERVAASWLAEAIDRRAAEMM